MEGGLRISDTDGTWSDAALPAVAPPVTRGIGWHLPRDSGRGATANPCMVPWWVSHVNVQRDGAGQEPAVSAPGSLTDAPGTASSAEAASSPHSALHLRRGHSPGRTRGRVTYGEAVPLAVGLNEMWLSPSAEPGSPVVHIQAVREEALQRLVPYLKPYEMAQVSVSVFVVGFCMALHMQFSSFLASPVLAMIPVLRICPEVPRLLFHREFKSEKIQRSLLRAAAILCVVWMAYVLMAHMRPAPISMPVHPATTPLVPANSDPLLTYPVHHHAPANCEGLPGVNCTAALSDWAGPGTCPVLALTQGTCASYCDFYKRSCVKGMDDVGTGECRLSGGARQQQHRDDCMQNLNTQICVCGPPDLRSQWQWPWPQQDVSEQESCGFGPRGPTEPTFAPSSAPFAGQPGQRNADHCFRFDLKFDPDMPGRAPTTARTASECQERCDNTHGCAYFTWWPASGACHFHLYHSKLAHALGALSGPANCADEAMLAELHGERLPPSGLPPHNLPLQGSSPPGFPPQGFQPQPAYAPGPYSLRDDLVAPRRQPPGPQVQPGTRAPPFEEGSARALLFALVAVGIAACVDVFGPTSLS